MPDSSYLKFRNVVEQRGLGIKEGVLKAINEFIATESEYERDAFFAIGSESESGLKDISKKHDAYLYEQ